MPHRQPEGADEGLVAGPRQVALDRHAAERVRAVQDPHLETGGERRFGGPYRGRGIGVVPRANVLQIDEQEVEAGEGGGAGPQRLDAVAVQRHDRRAGPRIGAAVGGDHVLLDAVKAVLGTEQRARRACRAGCQGAMDGAQVAGHRGAVRKQTVGPAAQLLQLLRRRQQPVEAGPDHVPRR